MPKIITPQKPFDNYKWRWATLTCTEGLNYPPVYLGVLRTLRKYEGFPPSDEQFLAALRVVEYQTNTNVKLARSARRNIIRNSGQYWKALGLMADTRGGILLTDYGKKIADGKITPTEFAMSVIKTLELPNPRIESNIEEWGTLRIKPLELILRILSLLAENFGVPEAYITPFELYRIVIPLAGINAIDETYIEAIYKYRDGKLDISDWPDCTPEANDKRMAREFLLFLSNYGFCQFDSTESRDFQRFILNVIPLAEINQFEQIDFTGSDLIRTPEIFHRIPLSGTIDQERSRVKTSVLSRPKQKDFRSAVLNAFNSTCILSKVDIPAVLEAIHIVPVADQGPDSLDNGLCMRVDIHRLFDSGHLRIDPNGRVFLSESANFKNNYSNLPDQIDFPDFISRDKIEWRWNYT